MDYANDPEYLALVRAVCAHPGDDLPRLRIADWLEERGESERAEFIRNQIEWFSLMSYALPHNGGTSTGPDMAKQKRERLAELQKRDRELMRCSFIQEQLPQGESWVINWERGFVSCIECTLVQFMGGECLRCEGHRWILGRRVPGDDPRYSMPCPDCKGTGHAHGLVDTLFGCQPIESVTISDIPQQFMAWRTWGQGMGLPDKDYREWRLALAMAEADAVASGAFDAKELEKAVSRACVALGRKRAGLPPLAPA